MVESRPGKQLRVTEVRGLVPFEQRRTVLGWLHRSAFLCSWLDVALAGQLPTTLEWLGCLNALRVLAQVSAAEQIVGPERG